MIAIAAVVGAAAATSSIYRACAAHSTCGRGALNAIAGRRHRALFRLQIRSIIASANRASMPLIPDFVTASANFGEETTPTRPKMLPRLSGALAARAHRSATRRKCTPSRAPQQQPIGQPDRPHPPDGPANPAAAPAEPPARRLRFGVEAGLEMKLLGAAALVWGLGYLYTAVFGTWSERRSEERRALDPRLEPAQHACRPRWDGL